MKTARILPVALLEKKSSTYHLVLSYLAQKNPEYRQFYCQRAQAGDFVILDNSAHELGSSGDWRELISLAEEMEVSEVVLPDRLFFGDDTYNQSREAIKGLRFHSLETRTMGVPQGRTPQEFSKCLSKLLDLGIDTVGISKDFEVWPGGIRALVEEVCTEDDDVQVHLLGWGRDLKQLYLIGSCPWLKHRIRGVDSAKPAVFAAAGISLPSSPWASPPVYPTRQKNFFDLKDVDEELLSRNLSIFQAWAKGEVPNV